VAYPVDLDPAVLALGDEQDGLVTREQLAAAGVGRDHVRNQVRARRWRLVGRVIVTHRGPLTRRQRWWAAVLHAGQGAVLGSLTAAEAHGLEGWESERVHVVVANGARVHPLPWMRVHVSRRLRPQDVHETRTPPQVTAARAVVDSATWKPHPRLACALLTAGVQQRLVTVDQLADEIERAGQIRHRRAMRRVLLDIAGGSQALSEIDFVRICRRAGLPRPDQQVVRVDAGGRRRYLDARVVRPDGRVILIEVDGAVHLRVDRWWDDQHRSNEVTLAEDNAMLLRFPAVVLRTDQSSVIEQLQRAYFGFVPPARRDARRSARPA
jgi:hypothetical protein